MLSQGGNGSPPSTPPGPHRATWHVSPSPPLKKPSPPPRRGSPPPRYQHRQYSQQYPQHTTHDFGIDYDQLEQNPNFHKYMDQYVELNKD